ncbi:MAG: OmpH family outer membrane protein [bacterium]
MPTLHLSFDRRSTIAALCAGALVATLGFLGTAAQAIRPTALPAPATAIGTVDLARLFDSLAAAKEWDVRIKELEAKAMDEGRAKKAALDASVKEVEAMAAGPEREARMDALRLTRLQAEQWSQLKELEVDRERSLKWQAIYRSVREGAKKLADAEGYGLIVVDDSRIEITTQRGQNAPPLETQAKSQIASLRVLYAGKSIDVTDKLRVQLDNDRSGSPAKAGGAATGAAAGTSSGTSSGTSAQPK